jgi:hypothetical protein
MPKCLQVASVGGTESIILSAGSAESNILSAGGAESMMLSACAESMIVSALPADSMILSAPFDCVIMLTRYYIMVAQGGATKKATIGNTDDCQLMTLVYSASTVPPIGLPQKGAKFCHISNRLLVGHQCRRALSPL